MLNVHVLYEHSEDLIPHGASTLRLLRPLSHPKIAKSIIMSCGIFYEGIETDIIIVDRLWKTGIKINDAEKLVEYTRKNKITLIYSIDDNLLDLRINEPGNIFPTVHERNTIRYFIRESDGVIVSTNALRERIKNLNDRVIVVENVLDEQLIDKKKRNALLKKFKASHENKDKLVIGYMGTPTHNRDFIIVLPAIKKILYKYTNVRLEILGALSDRSLLKLLPSASEVDVGENVEYTKFMRWMNEHIFWDIAIAPLDADEFTKCKSDIKFLDYSALGIPAIFTKYAPYENTVIHGKTGLLVENNIESWVEAFEQLISDEKLRINLAKNANEYVFSNRILEKCVYKWEEALLTLHNNKKLQLKDNSMIVDEHFVPNLGLDLESYIKIGDTSGVHHIIRYYWALRVIFDFHSVRSILDVACGAGYGSYLIAKKFQHIHVIGVDYDHEAIRYAQQNYSLSNLEFKFGDATRWKETIGKNRFDCIISFDTIEHINHREIMMQNLVEHLHNDGFLLLSTPSGSINFNLNPEWEHHKIEYSTGSLYDFLRRYFNTVLRPDDSSLPHSDVFSCLNGREIEYLLLMNPVLCKDPIVIENPYR